jgi:catechol 2,3-dioxygenase-like lactoylglutathione lyase family enzyme
MTMRYLDAFSSFSVDDLGRARSFYGDTLGLETADDPMGLVLDLRGTRVFVYEKADHAPATHTVLNLDVADIGEAREALERAGVGFESYEGAKVHEEEGMKIAWFRDPAGNFVSIIEEARRR